MVFVPLRTTKDKNNEMFIGHTNSLHINVSFHGTSAKFNNNKKLQVA